LEHTSGLGRCPEGNWTLADSDPSCAHQANLLMSQGSGYVARRNDLHKTSRRDVLFAECNF
jgi:hypothetical protein